MPLWGPSGSTSTRAVVRWGPQKHKTLISYAIIGPIRQHIDPSAVPWSGGVLKNPRPRYYMPSWGPSSSTSIRRPCRGQVGSPKTQDAGIICHHGAHPAAHRPVGRAVVRWDPRKPKTLIPYAIMGPIRQHIDPSAVPWSGGVPENPRPRYLYRHGAHPAAHRPVPWSGGVPKNTRR